MTKARHDYTHRHFLFRPLWLRGLRRHHRWLFRAVLALPLLILIAGVIAFRSPLTRALVLPKVEAALNLKVEADSVYVNGAGDLVLNRARFILPNVPGPAGRFLRVGRVTADIDWKAILSGEVRFRSIQMVEPILTISQSLSDRSLNLGALDLPKSSGSMAIPAISAVNAGVELGEHRGPVYKALKHVVVNGRFGPVPDDAGGAYAFSLEESGAHARHAGAPPGTGFKVSGTLHPDGRLEGVIDNFSLNEWGPESIPTPTRDLFTDLGLDDLAGDVARAGFNYAPRQGLTAELDVRGVGMNIPIQPDTFADPREPPMMGPPGRSMRMHGVSGKIVFAKDRVTADVQGRIEDVPYTVALAYSGTDLNSPFVCDIESHGFRLQKNSTILPFLPPRVGEILGLFSGPTAVLDSHVRLSRAGPQGSEAAEIRFGGDVEVSEGIAAFELFPYEFEKLAARVTFNNDRVDIVRVTGESESGAKLVAHGYISPLDDQAEMLIDVDVTGAPIDRKLQEAFGPGRQGIVPALFNREKYERLIHEGLVRSPQQAAAENAELERVRGLVASQSGAEAEETKQQIERLAARASIPEFEFGGAIDVSVRVHSPMGRNTGWRTQVDVDFPRVGLVPEKFAYPVIAEHVHARVVDDSGQITEGTFRGVRGGTAEVEAYFRIPAKSDPDQEARPEITIAAHQVPMDELVINALPVGDREPGEPLAGKTPVAQAPSIKEILRRLRLSGVGEADVRIADRPETARESGFDADVRVEGLRAAPEAWAGSAPLVVNGIAGRVMVSEERLALDLSGQPERKQGPVSGPLALHAEAAFTGRGAAGSTSYSATVSVPGVALDAPVESLVAAVSQEGAKEIADLRRVHRPSGTVDASVRITSSGGAPAHAEIGLSNPRSLGADVLGGRMEVASASGSATVDTAAKVVRFEHAAAPVSFQGAPSGEFTLEGELGVGEAAGGAKPTRPLTLSLREGAFEAPLVFRIMEDRLGRDAALAFGEYHPQGRFDAELELRPPARAGGPPVVKGTVRPRTLTAMLAGRQVMLQQMSGSLEFDADSGTLRTLSGVAPDWSGSVDGAWQMKEGGGYELQTQIALRGRKLTDDLRAALPADLQAALKSISLDIDGRFELEDASLSTGSGAQGRWVRFDGGLAFDGASFDVGIPIRGMTGRLRATLDSPAGTGAARYSVDIDADAFSVTGAYVRNGRATLRSGERAGDMVLESASGECYGGRLSARAEIAAGEMPAAPRRLEADVRLAGVRFAPLLDALTARPGQEGPLPPDESRDNDQSRGLLDAGLSLGGEVGRPETRRGQGLIRISGGRIIRVPLVMELVEVSNLQLPSNSRLDFARGAFYLEGTRMVFEELSILSKAVEVVGSGTIDWPTQAIDFSFNSRSARPIPLVSKVIQGIRDELITTRVTGVLSSPVVTLQQFPGPRRILGRSQGSAGPSEKEFESRAAAAEARSNRRSGGIPAEAPETARRPRTPDRPAEPLPQMSPGTP